MRRRLLPALVLLTACGGSRAADPAPGPDAAPPPRVQYAAGSWEYAAVSHRVVEQEINGRIQEDRLVSRYLLSAHVLAADGTLPVRFVLDSIGIDGNAGFPPAELARVTGTEYQARLLPTGRLVDFSGGDSSVALANQVATTLREFFPHIPADGVMPGDSWVDTVQSVTDVGGVLLTVRAVNWREALDWEEYAGRPALRIRMRSEYTMAGTGEQAGQELQLEGQGRREGSEFLAADGAYLGSVAADSSSFQVFLPAYGVTIPGQQRAADTVRVTT